jgi:hypothetical protein
MIQKQKPTKTYHFAPALVLIVLAPTIAEILLGDLLFNANFAPTLLIYVLLYGSGALLVREVARRLHLGWPSIIVLALAYGVVEEGLLLQTVFNQHFPGLEAQEAYGRAMGVSWFWLIGVLAIHGVWSITLPILVTERLFPSLAGRPWLGRLGLSLDAIVYILTGLVMFRFFTIFTHFSASSIALLLTTLGVVVLVWLALAVVPRMKAVPRGKSVPAPFLVGMIAFLAGVLFFGIQLFFPMVPTIPPLLPMLLYGILYAVVVMLIWHWSATSGWTPQYQLALAAGALLTYMLYGFRLSARGSLADLIFHGAVCVVIAWMLAWMFSRFSHASSRPEVC